MIDLKTLAMQENRHLVMEAAGFTQQGGAELRRLAMRYLALREQYVDLCVADDKLHGTKRFGTANKIRAEYDSDADRLIQEMLK